MRLFVLLEDKRPITLWFRDDTTILDAKRGIEASKRCTLDTSRMRLLCGAKEMLNDRKLEEYSSPSSPQQVHAVLQLSPPASSSNSYISHVFPSDSSRSNKADTSIELLLNRSLPLSLSIEPQHYGDAFSVFGERNQAIDGTFTFDEIAGRLSFYGNLHYDMEYYVYITGKFLTRTQNGALETPIESFGNYEWSFRTSKLDSIRLQVTRRLEQEHTEIAVPQVIKTSALIVLNRQSLSLYNELVQSIGRRFEIDPLEITDIVRYDTDGSSRPVQTYTDVAELTETCSLSFTVSEAAKAAALERIERETKPRWTAEEWVTYNEENWVNDASGYLAVCGKLSEEEESDIILQLVQAFEHNEDNRDGIAADSDSGMAKKYELIPQAVARVVDLQTNEEEGCAITAPVSIAAAARLSPRAGIVTDAMIAKRSRYELDGSRAAGAAGEAGVAEEGPYSASSCSAGSGSGSGSGSGVFHLRSAAASATGGGNSRALDADEIKRLQESLEDAIVPPEMRQIVWSSDSNSSSSTDANNTNVTTNVSAANSASTPTCAFSSSASSTSAATVSTPSEKDHHSSSSSTAIIDGGVRTSSTTRPFRVFPLQYSYADTEADRGSRLSGDEHTSGAGTSAGASGISTSTSTATATQPYAALRAEDIVALVQEFKHRGFAFVRFDERALATIESTAESAKKFFNLPAEQKARCSYRGQKYLGYVYNELFNKELFQLRRFDEDIQRELKEAIWSCEHEGIPGINTGGTGTGSNSLGNSSSSDRGLGFNDKGSDERLGFHEGVDKGYQFLFQTAVELTKQILCSIGSLEQTPDYLDSLFEPAQNDASFEHLLSRSNLTLFRYNVPEGEVRTTVHCPCHSDIGFMTIIPRNRDPAVSGLHCLDYDNFLWSDIERLAPHDVGVIFPGEMMTYLTNGYILPCMHEVANVGPGSRLSMALQLCAAESAILRPALFTNCNNNLAAAAIESAAAAAAIESATDDGSFKNNTAEEHKYEHTRRARSLDDSNGSSYHGSSNNGSIEEYTDRAEEGSESTNFKNMHSNKEVRAGVFMQELSASRVSSNFLRVPASAASRTASTTGSTGSNTHQF